MIITTTTSVAFKVPDEYEQAMDFKDKHPDWKDVSDSNVWRYTSTQSFFTTGGESDG